MTTGNEVSKPDAATALPDPVGHRAHVIPLGVSYRARKLRVKNAGQLVLLKRY